MSLRCVHISPDAAGIGGAAMAALRIHRSMLAGGIQSHIVCWDCPKDPCAIFVRVKGLCRFLRLFSKAVSRLMCYPNCPTGFIPSHLYKAANRQLHDAVVLHWLQLDTLSMREILKLEGPVFWYHHDLWPIRGITAYEGIQVPPQLGWLDRLVKWNKRRVADQMGVRLIPVCASRWVADEIRKSRMYVREPLVIPLPIEDVFRVGPRNPKVKFRILNGTRGGFRTGIKGGDRLLLALKLIPEKVRQDIEVVVFGEDGLSGAQNGFQVRFTGCLYGETLAQAYRDADVFAFPSRQETFGQTKMEALACGTPVVAFDETACAEGIQHKKNGWIASPDSISDFADGILYFYHAWKSGNAIRDDPQDDYRPATIAKQWHQALIKELLQ